MGRRIRREAGSGVGTVRQALAATCPFCEEVDFVAKTSPAEFARQVNAERKKISWPTQRETLMTTVMVLIMTTLLGLFFFGVDLMFSKVREAIFSLLV